jgi:photosystem II stability/assembly factor-like uncharacterized protein
MRFPVLIEKLTRFIFALALTGSMLGTGLVSPVRAQEQETLKLDKFDLLTVDTGWILIGQHLFWTSDMGQNWEEIGPSVPLGSSIQDVKFIDINKGWILSTSINSDARCSVQLAVTADRGGTWTTRTLPLFVPGDVAAYVEKAAMGWLDSQTGWIALKQVSSSNFSIGTLFTTSDGGNSWNRFPLPVANKVYFSEPDTGWAVGGPANDQVFTTHDGGATWLSVRPADLPDAIPMVVYPPFISGSQGILVLNTQGEESSLRVYSLEASSGMWQFLDARKLDIQAGVIGLSILDARNFVAAIPGTNSIVQMKNDHLQRLENVDGFSASIVEMDMVSLAFGWAKRIASRCNSNSQPDPVSPPDSCLAEAQLIATTNGGITWQRINTPTVLSPSNGALSSGAVEGGASDILTLPANTEAFTGQGFDKCELPTLSQMETWAMAGPYKAVNLYIGGSSRGCQNSALNPQYLFQLHRLGWKFIPTWVGPQAPCTWFNARISSDVANAYAQGVEEADLAVEQLASLGLTGTDKSGSVVYYDIENYGTNVSCRNAVNAFMNGWVSQLRARGHLAGVYGSTLCDTGLSDFRTIANVPDLIWAARWYHNLGAGYYDPSASVWNLGSCVPNSVWASHQRVRQYEGDHNESWGNVIMNIDSDVLDSVVAIPYPYPFITSIARKDANYTNASVVNFTVTFTEPVSGVDKGDFKLMINGVSGASIGTVSGSGAVYTVSVNTGSGNGAIRLDALDNNTILDANGDPFGGIGSGNGGFSAGETYQIDKSRATVGISLGSVEMGSYIISIHTALIQDYFYVNDGPVKVNNLSTNGFPVIASQRVIYGSWSYSELMGMPFEQLSKEYIFPYYNNVAMDSQLRVSNVGGANTTITVYLGADPQPIDSYTLAAGGATRKNYPFNSGPLRVRSSASNILATIRVLYGGSSYSELMGFPLEQLTKEYLFPYYNNYAMDSQLRVSNVGGADTTIKIYLGADPDPIDSYTLAAGSASRKNYPFNSGPLRVTSSASNILTTIRVLYGGSSYSELMGFPTGQLSQSYWYPVYDNSSVNSQLRVSNVGSDTTRITVYAGTEQIDSYDLEASAAIRLNYAKDTGPLHIVSSSQPILTTVRLLYGSSLYEITGLPESQLSTRYFFPWYNNSGMSSELRFAVP